MSQLVSHVTGVSTAGPHLQQVASTWACTTGDVAKAESKQRVAMACLIVSLCYLTAT